MKKITRADAKAQFKNDVDAYGKPKKIMRKLDIIFDYVEYLEEIIEAVKKTKEREKKCL